MRRTLSILIVLTLAVCATALTSCASGWRNECPTICQPNRTYEHVVSERCFPIDRNGNPLYRRAP